MPEYTPSIVTFIDILGFRHIVSSCGPEEIDDMLNDITETAAATDFWAPTDVLSFSDSVVRSRRYESGIYPAALCEITELAYAQFELARKGILIRGGMTVGDVRVSEGRIFGPGFVRAYDLESRFAGSPRIVVDPVLIRELRRQRTTADVELRKEIRRVREWIVQGDDGLWFVDYLRSQYMAEAPVGHAYMMRAHRDMIIGRARDMDPVSPLVPKYLWLSRYHNSAASKLHPDMEEIRIRRRDIPIFDELLLPRRRGKVPRASAASPTSKRCR